MYTRRLSLLAGASALLGVLGGLFNGRGGTVLTNADSDPGPKPTTRGRQPRKSSIRGRGYAMPRRMIWTGKEICDARNHRAGKIYSALDRYFLALAEAKRERKRAKRLKDLAAMRVGYSRCHFAAVGVSV